MKVSMKDCSKGLLDSGQHTSYDMLAIITDML